MHWATVTTGAWLGQAQGIWRDGIRDLPGGRGRAPRLGRSSGVGDGGWRADSVGGMR